MSKEEHQISLDELKAEAKLSKKQKEAKEKMQLIVFQLGQEEYALPISQIKEIILTPRLAKVPQTPNYILGASNIRGVIVAIIDLEIKFGIHDVNDNTIGEYVLVIAIEGYSVGLVVKQVPNTLTVALDDIDTSEGVLQFSSSDQNPISGILKEEDRMILMIDVVKAIEKKEIIDIVK